MKMQVEDYEENMEIDVNEDYFLNPVDEYCCDDFIGSAIHAQFVLNNHNFFINIVDKGAETMECIPIQYCQNCGEKITLVGKYQYIEDDDEDDDTE